MVVSFDGVSGLICLEKIVFSRARVCCTASVAVNGFSSEFSTTMFVDCLFDGAEKNFLLAFA